jgi:type II secretion system protein N
MAPVNVLQQALQKKWVRIAGYVLFGFVCLLYAMHLTLPYARAEQFLQDWAGEGFDVRVGSAGPGWFPGDVVLEDVSFKSRPARDGDKPVEFVIDRIEVDVGVLALMGGSIDIAFDGDVSGGSVRGRVRASKAQAKLDIRTSGVPFENLPGIKTVTGGVPMTGSLEARVDITLPKGKWREANGVMTLECQSCTIGDGVAKIRPQAPGQQSAFSDGGFTLPKLKLGKLGGKLVVAKGLGKFENFEGKSPDGELYLDGDIRFEDPFVRSQVTAYMRFKSSDELKKREPVMSDIELLMKAASLRPDGYYGVKVTGPLNALRFLGSKISPVPTKDKDAGPGGRGRPGTGVLGSATGRGEEPGMPPSVNLNPPPPTPPPGSSGAPPVDPPPPTDTPSSGTPPPGDATGPGTSTGPQPPQPSGDGSAQPLQPMPMQPSVRALTPDEPARPPDSAQPPPPPPAPDGTQPAPQDAPPQVE